VQIDDFPAALVAARALDDPAERAKALSEVLAALPDVQAVLRTERQEAVRTLHEDLHLSWAQIGEILGVHRNRAAQIAGGVTGGAKKRAE